MDLTLDATYDGEVFRPDEPIDLEPNTKAKIIVEDAENRKLAEKHEKKTGEPYAFLKYTASLELDGPSDFSIKHLCDEQKF